MISPTVWRGLSDAYGSWKTIATSLETSPTVLLADEPTTALDVTVQAQILELIGSITREYRTATMLITHNLGVVSGICDRVIVMYAGKVVESGTTEEVLVRPRHPYTWGLLQSQPQLDRPGKYALRAIEGAPPDPPPSRPGARSIPGARSGSRAARPTSPP